jgi:hypothetical protein
MANSVTSGLENILGIDTTAGNSQIQSAIDALNAVGVPTAQQLDLPTLQKYVSAGVLTPAQYQAIQENPNVYSQSIQQNQDNTGLQAQKAALQQLGGISQTGSTPIMQAQLMNAINTANQSAQANRGAVQENAQERGIAGGGQELLGQLVGNQGAATTANQGALTAASNNAQLALQALANQGTLGGQVQSESQQSAQAQAQAAAQIAQYNSQLQSAANQYNTQNANQAQQMNLQNAQNISSANTGLANQQTEYNAQVPETIYNNQMGKAQAEAGEYNQAANLAEQQAQQQNQFTGSLIGAGATLGGDYMLGQGISGLQNAGQAANSGAMTGTEAVNTGYGSTPNSQNANPSQYGIPQNPYAMGGEVKGYCGGGTCYAQGGEVHDHEICMKLGGPVPGTPNVPGDSTENDTVPARLSPHEIVLPRTVAQAPDAPAKAAQFVGQIKGQIPPEAGPMIGDAISQMGPQKSFADIIKELEANGLELRLGTK